MKENHIIQILRNFYTQGSMFNQKLWALSKLRTKTKKKADGRNRFTDDPVTGAIA